jgi:hypothetical protein
MTIEKANGRRQPAGDGFEKANGRLVMASTSRLTPAVRPLHERVLPHLFQRFEDRF